MGPTRYGRQANWLLLIFFKLTALHSLQSKNFQTIFSIHSRINTQGINTLLSTFNNQYEPENNLLSFFLS